jgi:hypothetical protein
MARFDVHRPDDACYEYVMMMVTLYFRVHYL